MKFIKTDYYELIHYSIIERIKMHQDMFTENLYWIDGYYKKGGSVTLFKFHSHEDAKKRFDELCLEFENNSGENRE